MKRKLDDNEQQDSERIVRSRSDDSSSTEAPAPIEQVMEVEPTIVGVDRVVGGGADALLEMYELIANSSTADQIESIAESQIRKGLAVDYDTLFKLAFIKHNIPLAKVLTTNAFGVDVYLLFREAIVKDNRTLFEFIKTNYDLDLNYHNEGDDSFLILAIKNSSTIIAHRLINAGVNLNIQGKMGDTALMCAAQNNNQEIALALIEAEGIELNAKNQFDNTALIIASRKWDSKIAKPLMAAKGIDLNARNKDGDTALICAVQNSCEEIALALIASEGIDLNAGNTRGTVLIRAVDHNNIKIVKSLIAAGVNLNAQNSIGNTALMWAAQSGYTEIAQALIAADEIDLNTQDNKGNTALMSAAQSGYTEIVKALIVAEGIECNTKDNNGSTALIKATANGHTEIAQALIAAGADLNAKDDDQYTALMFAADDGHTEIAQALIAAGIDLNAQNARGDTALMCAALQGRIEIVKALIVAGVDLNAQSTNGESDTALIFAAAKGHTEIVKALIAAGIELNAQNIDGDTALMWAAENGHTDVAKALIAAKGIDLNTQNEKGDTALMWAAANGRTEIAQALILEGATCYGASNPLVKALSLIVSAADIYARGCNDDIDLNIKDPIFIARMVFHLSDILSKGREYQGKDIGLLNEEVKNKIFGGVIERLQTKGLRVSYDNFLSKLESQDLPAEWKDNISKLIKESKGIVDSNESALRGEVEGISIVAPHCINLQTKLLNVGEDMINDISPETVAYYEEHKQEHTTPGTYLHKMIHGRDALYNFNHLSSALLGNSDALTAFYHLMKILKGSKIILDKNTKDFVNHPTLKQCYQQIKQSEANHESVVEMEVEIQDLLMDDGHDHAGHEHDVIEVMGEAMPVSDGF